MLLDGKFYAGDPRPAYAELRAQGGVVFDADADAWGIASYDAVVAAETDPGLFTSARGTRPGTCQPSMIDMDDPAHQQRRSLVNKGFTPRRIADWEPRLHELTDRIIDAVCEQGECDLVRDIAAPLPLHVIGDMLGVAEEDRDDLLRWSDDMLASQGELTPEIIENVTKAAGEYYAYAMRVIGERRAKPSDDLIGVLVSAEVDGKGMDDLELIHESLLLLVGGDETTRHVISGGVEALLQHSDQWDALRADPSGIPTAVEEMLRWVSPIKNMYRIVTRDAEFFGQQLHENDGALLLYPSANLDETHFTDPHRFDATRTPNNHIAFGLGTHFCLGASLARMELRVMLEHLLRRLPDLQLATDDALPRRHNAFISGLESMPVTFTPTAKAGA